MEQQDARTGLSQKQNQDINPVFPMMHQQAEQMMEPLVQFVHRYVSSRFVLERELPAGVDVWELVRTGKVAASPLRALAERKLEDAVSYPAKQALETNVYRQFQQFRTAAEQYAREQGNQAFCRLWTGSGEGPFPGMEQTVRMLLEDRNPRTGQPNVQPEIQPQLHRLRQAETVIRTADLGLAQRLQRAVNHARERETEQWLDAFEGVIQAELIRRRKRILLGQEGMLYHYFLKPARELYRELAAGASEESP